ncbi:C40 family peptidase [Amaricoccus solimangrovi]|uniref:NlpC/P60 family protein n=1 Tax=Amaricoccus solimangrovi TaxID=2589815 RepID=A0A501WTG0_9RHOB|nr:C40 family peptidase [Amaricoccus solimangrovi]TPE52649.1 NlpC/P60 family protein [Amaricoccus solimangrovi]
MSTRFARRLVPARPDLAADHLRGSVTAERYVPGTRYAVGAPLLDLSLTPDPEAGRDTQLLHGESFVVYETREDGLAWGQAELDGYVGYVAAEGLVAPRSRGQRITALWSHCYPAPLTRAKPVLELPFLAEVPVAGTSADFARLRDGRHVPRPHLAPVEGDFVDQAARFLGVPYLWGGRSARGLDCSALVQLALLATGIEAPRDSDMQAALLGEALAPDAPARRGDLVFWKGHVGILTDPETLLHANGHHMAVAREPLGLAIERIAAAGGGGVIARRRPVPAR